METLPVGLLLPFAFVLGLILGSFASVVSSRVPGWESIMGRSRCPNCGHTITAGENIPVISYLIQRGRCRHCTWTIPWKYPAIELVTGALFVVVVARFGWSFESVMYMALAWVLVVLAVIDFERHLLPDRIVLPALGAFLILVAVACTLDGAWGSRSGSAIAAAAGTLVSIALILPGANLRRPAGGSEADTDVDEEVEPLRATRGEQVLGLAYLIVWVFVVIAGLFAEPSERLWGALAGAFVFSGLFFALALILPRGMGLGDAKLGLLLGAAAGYQRAPGRVLVAMFVAFLIGTIGGVAEMVARGGTRKTKVPFGPYLAAGTLVALVWGEVLIDWYAGLLG